MFVESSLVTYTDTFVVPSGCVRPDLVDRAAAMQLPVPCDIEMIADIGESPCLVRGTECLDRKIPVISCGRAVNYKEADLPVILVETIGFAHNPQAVMPKAPAIAVATAMITLRMVLQTDFFMMNEL